MTITYERRSIYKLRALGGNMFGFRKIDPNDPKFSEPCSEKLTEKGVRGAYKTRLGLTEQLSEADIDVRIEAALREYERKGAPR